MKISNRCREIVLGSLLGDGSLRMRKKYNNARLEIRHSVIQKDYFFWKAKELKEISGDNCCRLQPADGWSKNIDMAVSMKGVNVYKRILIKHK